MREHDHPRRARRRGFDDDKPYVAKRTARDPRRLTSDTEADAAPPDGGDRWSTWDSGSQGPQPYPDWLVTDLAAVDTELGILKSGKEADVHLIRRGVPGTGRSCLLAAKRYRAAEHRMFHRDAGYLEGRRVRKSRETRAMARRTAFGRDVLAGQWAAAEFGALCLLWRLGAETGLGPVVPYPVQLVGTEVLLEFVGDADQGLAAPRLAQLRPGPDELAGLWRQLLDAVYLLARAGYAHGDLSSYNILVDRGRLVLIDLPQVVDVVVNPGGAAFLARDVATVAAWFTSRGLPGVDPPAITADLLAAAGIG